MIQQGPEVRFRVKGPLPHHPEIEGLSGRDDGRRDGPVLGGGRIGFRQMAPLIAEEGRLQVIRREGAEAFDRLLTDELVERNHEGGRGSRVRKLVVRCLDDAGGADFWAFARRAYATPNVERLA